MLFRRDMDASGSHFSYSIPCVLSPNGPVGWSWSCKWVWRSSDDGQTTVEGTANPPNGDGAVPTCIHQGWGANTGAWTLPSENKLNKPCWFTTMNESRGQTTSSKSLTVTPRGWGKEGTEYREHVLHVLQVLHTPLNNHRSRMRPFYLGLVGRS